MGSGEKLRREGRVGGVVRPAGPGAAGARRRRLRPPPSPPAAGCPAGRRPAAGGCGKGESRPAGCSGQGSSRGQGGPQARRRQPPKRAKPVCPPVGRAACGPRSPTGNRPQKDPGGAPCKTGQAVGAGKGYIMPERSLLAAIAAFNRHAG